MVGRIGPQHALSPRGSHQRKKAAHLAEATASEAANCQQRQQCQPAATTLPFLCSLRDRHGSTTSASTGCRVAPRVATVEIAAVAVATGATHCQQASSSHAAAGANALTPNVAWSEVVNATIAADTVNACVAAVAVARVVDSAGLVGASIVTTCNAAAIIIATTVVDSCQLKHLLAQITRTLLPRVIHQPVSKAAGRSSARASVRTQP